MTDTNKKKWQIPSFRANLTHVKQQGSKQGY